jgi:hypothetical protein
MVPVLSPTEYRALVETGALVLYISGFSLPELQRRGLLSAGELSPGAVDLLQKPFSSDQFLDRLNGLLPN